MVYLDWASTTPPDSGILDAAARLAAEEFGNPSSNHSLGSQARVELEKSRARLAAAIGDPGGRIVFTGSGTEADSIPLLSLLRTSMTARRGGEAKKLHLISTEIEHSAVYEQARVLVSMGIDTTFLRPEPDGRVPPERFGAALRRDTALVAVMAVNNETGAIQDLGGIVASLREAASGLGMRPPRVHVDAVQALGKMAFDPAALGLSSAAFSAHKLRGPRGVGALWTDAPFETLAAGGGQEGGMRPGTESLQGAWAFASAAEKAAATLEPRRSRARALEARLTDGLAAIGALALPLGRAGGDERYSPFILSAAFPGLSGEVLVRALSDEGIAVSTGAACSSNSRKKGRRVLEAMGLEKRMSFSSIRISIGEGTTEADLDLFLEHAAEIYGRFRT